LSHIIGTAIRASVMLPEIAYSDLGVMAQVFEIGPDDCASFSSESFGTRQALS
jgi:hypothetical protein